MQPETTTELISAPCTIAIVVPCYNEEAVIDETARVLSGLLVKLIKENRVDSSSKVVFVDDGSKDQTWVKIRDLSAGTPQITGLKLSANRGHQVALLAGLESSKDYDFLVTIDADLQDDPEIIGEMVELTKKGFEVVYGVRKDREVDTFFKKGTATFFYRLMHVFGAKIVPHHADFRLVSKRVLAALTEYREVNLFLRGIFPLIGFNSAFCYYKRNKRFAGESKYPFKKMVAFAVDGITSFSTTPLRIVTYLGFFTLVLTSLLTIWTVYIHIIGKALPGWSSIMVSIYFIASVQLLCMGVIGEYIGKIYQESKARPRYHVEEHADGN